MLAKALSTLGKIWCLNIGFVAMASVVLFMVGPSSSYSSMIERLLGLGMIPLTLITLFFIFFYIGPHLEEKKYERMRNDCGRSLKLLKEGVIEEFYIDRKLFGADGPEKLFGIKLVKSYESPGFSKFDSLNLDWLVNSVWYVPESDYREPDFIYLVGETGQKKLTVCQFLSEETKQLRLQISQYREKVQLLRNKDIESFDIDRSFFEKYGSKKIFGVELTKACQSPSSRGGDTAGFQWRVDLEWFTPNVTCNERDYLYLFGKTGDDELSASWYH